MHLREQTFKDLKMEETMMYVPGNCPDCVILCAFYVCMYKAPLVGKRHYQAQEISFSLLEFWMQHHLSFRHLILFTVLIFVWEMSDP